MRKLMLTALGLCLAVICPSSAQDVNINDTIIISPNEDAKILLLGNSLREIAEYSSVDTVIAFLIEDLQTAAANPDFPRNSLVTHYFIHESGKRRLKAQREDFAEPELNVEREVESLNLDLPPYLFHVHDLSKTIDIKIYIKDPEKLSLLKDAHIANAFIIVKEDKKTLRNHYRLGITRSGDSWIIKDKVRYTIDQLQIEPAFGVGAIGDKWSPCSQLGVYMMFTDKHGQPSVKAGASASAYAFHDDFFNDFDGAYVLVSIYKLEFKFNQFRTRKIPQWLGLGIGWSDSSKGYPLDKKTVVSITSEIISPLKVSFDMIRVNKHSSVNGFTLLFSF